MDELEELTQRELTKKFYDIDNMQNWLGKKYDENFSRMKKLKRKMFVRPLVIMKLDNELSTLMEISKILGECRGLIQTKINQKREKSK